jgi:hypothetical protein
MSYFKIIRNSLPPTLTTSSPWVERNLSPSEISSFAAQAPIVDGKKYQLVAHERTLEPWKICLRVIAGVAACIFSLCLALLSRDVLALFQSVKLRLYVQLKDDDTSQAGQVNAAVQATLFPQPLLSPLCSSPLKAQLPPIATIADAICKIQPNDPIAYPFHPKVVVEIKSILSKAHPTQADLNNLTAILEARDMLIFYAHIRKAWPMPSTAVPNSLDTFDDLLKEAKAAHTFLDSKKTIPVQALSFQGCQLYSLPTQIGRCIHIETLELNDNLLSTLPDEIGNLKLLRVLDLENNKLTTLPVTINQCTKLRDLLLDNNQLVTLPDEIGNLKELRELHLNNNLLTSIPDEIGNCTLLCDLGLGNNQLTTIPNTIGKCTMLKQIDLENNKLSALPDELDNLQELWELKLIGNPLKSLSTKLAEIGQPKEKSSEVPEVKAYPNRFVVREVKKKKRLSKTLSKESLRKKQPPKFSRKTSRPDLQ